MNLNLAVIGNPIHHSKSPIMQNAGLKALGFSGHYQPILVEIDRLKDFVEQARDSLDGFNVTVPFKQAIVPFLDELDESAKYSKSVNTVVNKNGILKGYSTDGYGLEMALHNAFQLDWHNSQICFLGCGGAVQAVSFHLLSLEIKRLIILNRTPAKAQVLCETLQCFYPKSLISFGALADSEISQLQNISVVINGTSLGLSPHDPSPCNVSLLPSTTQAFDMIYFETSFLKQCRSHGLKAVDGREMLLYQGVQALQLWTHCTPPIYEMREAFNRSLQDNVKI